MRPIRVISIVVTSLFISTTGLAQVYDFSKLVRVNNTYGEDLQYNYNRTFDFNKDGVDDIVNCSTSTFVNIIDGATRKSIFSWEGPLKSRVASNGYLHERTLSGCEVFQFSNNRPMIILANYWNTFTPKHVPYWRANAPQYVVYFDGNKFVVKELQIVGIEKYIGVVRSAKCGRYPGRLNEQFGEGALCFLSNYAAGEINYSTLLKFEYNAKKTALVVKDLTPSAGLHWRGGAAGTSIWSFPVGRGFASNQRDGAFMMDAAFVDFNGDNMHDLITVGQHAKIRAHRLVVDRNRKEGIRYVTTELTQADKFTNRTELLKVTALNRMNPKDPSNCVYISGENEGPNEKDQIYCYENGRYVVHNLPVVFNSEYYNARMQYLNNNLVIKTRKIPKDGSNPIDLTFRLPLL